MSLSARERVHVKLDQPQIEWAIKSLDKHGDTDLFPTVIAMLDQEPHISLTTADVGTVTNIAPGTTATP